ncbi:DUF2637 domain-containing protein [Streptomyces sp. NRRL_B-16638]|uniref:Membrane protein n=2 Tax=Streptomyces coelicolor TaxID=1902 RepID=Q9AD10_STRCO|nr:DUF2637 domain-containing protein [Streptomyces sp. NRRL_B-16638]AGO88602.1 hypothetical protein [Streptomyces coelicolor]MDX2930331.1 DUF2637 domain-containing protein [Streptomyces sp. NRRL_B-16638]CAC36661.1 putative membrane protein [Streptomyces coelicolor A3(2)]
MTAGTSKAPQLTRAHRVLVGVVVFGAVIIAGIGFAGSYAAVRELALKKGFGNFSYVFPIGIDAGICVLLAMDLLLTWIRIPFPLLRQTAWLLTAATIAFNGAAAWPDPLGVGMHGVIPVLFVVSVEAARHAIGRIADITADKHMEGVRLTRWLLSPVPTFLLWRRMKLWELRSYEQVIKLEQERLVYQARLRSRFGRAWRRKAPVESLMPLRLARYGVPLAQTAPSGLAAAGIDEPMPVLTGPPSATDPAPLTPASAEHQRALEVGGRAEAVSRDQDERQALSVPAAGKAVAVQQEELSEAAAEEATLGLTADSHSSFPAAYAEYLNHYGDFPNAHQFALFLADYYGIDDNGQPIPEKDLVPVVKQLRRRAENPGEWVTDPSVTDLPPTGMTDPSGTSPEQAAMTDPVGHAASVTAGPYVAGPSVTPSAAPQAPVAEPVPTASAADGPTAGGGLPRQTALDRTTGSVTGRPGGDAIPWEATVTDTGEATARVPEHQVDETPVGELTEQQRIELVVQWLLEAEAAGKRFSGAEAARRNGVSPKTGQRDVIKAKEIVKEQERDRGRAHLRSVRND